MLAARAANIRLVRVLLKHAPVPNLLIVAELISIKAHHLSFAADTEVHAGNELERVQQDARNGKGVGCNGDNLGELTTNLDTDAIHAAETVVWAHSVKIVDPGLSENSGEERANHASNSMKFEHIHTFIDLDPLVNVLAETTDSTCQESN
jgi:hypothetical protein